MIHFRSAEVRLFFVTGKSSYTERKLCDGGVVKPSDSTATDRTTPIPDGVTCPACEAMIQQARHYMKAIDEDVELCRYES